MSISKIHAQLKYGTFKLVKAPVRLPFPKDDRNTPAKSYQIDNTLLSLSVITQKVKKSMAIRSPNLSDALTRSIAS
jgi:hypothetical protein